MTASWNALDFGQKTRRAHSLFWWAIVGPVIVIAFAFTAASSFMDARAILDDHSVAQATVTFDDAVPQRKNQLHFNYAFTVDGKPYSGKFSTSIARADDVVSGDTVPVVSRMPIRTGRKRTNRLPAMAMDAMRSSSS